MIEINDLSFSYQEQRLFRGMQMTLEPGNIYGLLGVNGAGKSTLLRLITGLLFASSGSVRTLGHDPAERDPSLLSRVFVLPEELNLPNATGAEYLRTRAPFYRSFNRDRFDRYLAEFELQPERKLSSLSHGQKKKFLLSFGLACESPLLLLDEPTNGLDIPSKAQFRRLIAEATTPERLFIIATHQVRDLGSLLDPIVILHQGRVLFNRTLAEIGSRIRMSHSPSPPNTNAPGFLYSEPAVGGFWSVWQDTAAADGMLDLEVLFNTLISRPELGTSLFATNRGAA
jgi:ABC-2 type transport system ATP-binding protein